MSVRSCRACGAAAAASIVAFLSTVAPASAATVTADQARDETCVAEKRTDAAVGGRNFGVTGVSAVTATLSGAGGNWDLAIVDETGRVVAGSAFADGNEIAEGFSTGSGELWVQACRRSGSDSTAQIDFASTELTEPADRLQLVRVATPTEADADRLTSLGLDLTEHGGDGYLDVVLHSEAEGALLTDEGFTYEVQNPDLAKQSVADRAIEQRLAARGEPSTLPSGRTDTYRELADYSEELQQLAQDNPKLVKYFTLKKETYSGRPVEAIEVTKGVNRKDGKPVFLMTGVHHAREWPSSEHTLEYAYELINGFNDGAAGVKRLLKRARVIFVPIVNPDGFNVSRGAASALAQPGGRDAPAGDETANLVIPYEYHRKNCRVVPPSEPPTANCMGQPATGIAQFGVDPNRNYGGFWGGPGASSEDSLPFGSTAADYRGPAPFSEPETQNIRKLVSKNQVTTLISNHTFSNLVLHPPGLQSQGKPRDDKELKALAESMAQENGYEPQRGYELYDTSGTTEDWSYNATSGFGYTFEIGPSAFHPVYQSVADEYSGNTEAAEGGGGNRAAYFKALRHTAKAKNHSLIAGEAPANSHLTLKKKFKTPTSPVIDGSGEEGDVILLKEKLRSVLAVNRSGKFKWHVNPSTRPIVDPRVKRVEAKKGKPSDPIEFAGGPGPDATPCAEYETEDPACFNDHPFKVERGKGIDNGKATVRVTWATPASDWDLKVFKDTDGDGTSEGETKLFGSSADGPSNVETTTLAGLTFKPGKYVARMINFAASEPYDGTVTFNKTEKATIKSGYEKYTLACRAKKGGPVLSRQKVQIDRGQRLSVDLTKTCS